MNTTSFVSRHTGISSSDEKEMLSSIGLDSIETLIEQTIPKSIRSNKALQVGPAMSESEYIQHIDALAAKNKLYTSYIGLGYHSAILPSVIQRNIFENPNWYTAYTPYQAEISQGRLEALLNFQTMVIELTAMEIANASLLDEGTAAAEAMILAYNKRSRNKKKLPKSLFLVDSNCLPQTIDVLTTRATPLNIELVIADPQNFDYTEEVFGGIVQYPNKLGEIQSHSEVTKELHAIDALSIVAADLLSLTLITPPGEWGADVVVGSSQRFGVPLGFGGPHAAFFATKDKFKRQIPGRIIGVTKDTKGHRALRMALQTREQHIKRDKATSNICTSQVLLAVISSMYAVYHGPEGLKYIAHEIYKKTLRLSLAIKAMGGVQINKDFFDTLTFEITNSQKDLLLVLSEKYGVNFYFEPGRVSLSIGEVVTESDISVLLEVFGSVYDKVAPSSELEYTPISFARKSAFMQMPVFNSYHSETEMMRYIKSLEKKDLSLTDAMIPLGSCTMKLNAASELIPLSNKNWSMIHPFAPSSQTEGYQIVLDELAKDLAVITGFDKVSLQPNSGAQGEYAGLLVIKAYQESLGQQHRNIALIPSSAHGTNPASAIMAGLKVVVVACDDAGNIDVTDLKEKSEQYADSLSCLMITYPSTHGVFEERIIEITDMIHANGGQVYMDGANMNAQVGLTSPGLIGADVCHLNLHKTFAIPHGGGGPGVGPIGVAKHLSPFLPSNPLVKTGGDKAITAISSAPFGSAYVSIISYGYIKMLGAKGLLKSTELAILNANYIKSKLKEHYDILYTNKNGRVAHEMILECRNFKTEAKIEVTDIAKRLMDYGFHAPTISFPVVGTMMVEPTESESKKELDHFVEAMISIRYEIDDIINNRDKERNILKNAPHILENIVSDSWDHYYTRNDAVFPKDWVKNNKYWPTVNRVDDAYGDRNLVCSCSPIEAYLEEV